MQMYKGIQKLLKSLIANNPQIYYIYLINNIFC